MNLQAAVEASNAALAKSVSDFHERRRCLEEQMRLRREKYCELFGAPSKSPRPPRKGDRSLMFLLLVLVV